MLRIKRSVQAMYNTQVNFMSAQMLAAAGAKGDNAGNLSVFRVTSLQLQCFQHWFEIRIFPNSFNILSASSELLGQEKHVQTK